MKKIYIPINKRFPDERPRERLIRYGADKLSSAELLGILLRVGRKGKSAVQIAQELLESYGDGVTMLGKLTLTEFVNIKGIGSAKAATILAAFELVKRANRKQKNCNKIYFKTIEDVADYFRKYYGTGTPEKFVTFYINRNYRLLGELEVSRGGSNAVVVNPQIVIKEAILRDTHILILAHNHPGGSLRPSKDDISLTNLIIDAGKLFSITLCEHVIVTEESCIGLLESATIKNPFDFQSSSE